MDLKFRMDLQKNTTHHKYKDVGLKSVRAQSMSLHLPSTLVVLILDLYNEVSSTKKFVNYGMISYFNRRHPNVVY